MVCKYGDWKKTRIGGEWAILGVFTGANGYNGWYNGPDEDEINIISAAPDMLEALESIKNDNNNIPSPIWKMIKKAIKKAKGGK